MELFYSSAMTVTLSIDVATHVLELSEKGSTLYLGDYDYYVEKKAEVEMTQAEEASTNKHVKASSPVNDYQAQKESQKRSSQTTCDKSKS